MGGGVNLFAAENISKSFGKTQVLRNFSIEMNPGEITVLMGPSGCGKSTLLSILIGLISPDAGRVTGRPERLSVIFQENRLSEDFTALQNVTLVAPQKPIQEAKKLLVAVGLQDALHQKTAELSGGMKRRIAIARALFYDGGALLMDEPFKGLDQDTKETVMALVRGEVKNRPVLCITHDEKEAEFLGGRLIQMEPVALGFR